ncbi:MAG: hypothetical protein ISQ32_00660 [Rickettsiales bacterium]|nr:hypothetical protein [Rickettsiales bacterium]
MISFNETFWVAAAFVIFVGLIYKIIKNAILNALDNKISAVKDSINEAEKIKLEAEKILQEVKEKEKAINLQADKIVDNAKTRIKVLEENSTNKIEKEIKRKSVSVKQNFEYDKNNFMKKLTKNIVDDVFDIVEGTLKKQDKKFAQNFSDNNIKELKNKIS